MDKTPEPMAWMYTAGALRTVSPERLNDEAPWNEWTETPLYIWPADDIARQLAQAIPCEIVDSGSWKLSFDFGKGDEARDKMRAVADAVRAIGRR
jgi:hypothetical protein